jgi:hypothetical protein
MTKALIVGATIRPIDSLTGFIDDYHIIDLDTNLTEYYKNIIDNNYIADKIVEITGTNDIQIDIHIYDGDITPFKDNEYHDTEIFVLFDSLIEQDFTDISKAIYNNELISEDATVYEIDTETYNIREVEPEYGI